MSGSLNYGTNLVVLRYGRSTLSHWKSSLCARNMHSVHRTYGDAHQLRRGADSSRTQTHSVSLFTVQLRDTEFPKKATEKAGITYLHADTNHTFETTRRFMDNYSAATITSWSSIASAYHSSIPIGRYFRDVLQTTWKALDTPSLKNFDLLLATEFISHVAMCLRKKWRILLLVIIVSSTREMFHHQHPPCPFPGYDSKWTENLDFLGRLFFLRSSNRCLRGCLPT